MRILGLSVFVLLLTSPLFANSFNGFATEQGQYVYLGNPNLIIRPEAMGTLLGFGTRFPNTFRGTITLTFSIFGQSYVQSTDITTPAIGVIFEFAPNQWVRGARGEVALPMAHFGVVVQFEIHRAGNRLKLWETDRMSKPYIPKRGQAVLVDRVKSRLVVVDVDSGKKTALVATATTPPVSYTVAWDKLTLSDESQNAARMVKEATEEWGSTYGRMDIKLHHYPLWQLRDFAALVS